MSEAGCVTLPNLAAKPFPWLAVRIDHRFPGCHLHLTCQLAAPRTVVFGPSGSGKSSLLRAIAGLLLPEEGTIRIFDRMVWERQRSDPAQGKSPHSLRVEDRHVGLVLQSPALFPHLTVAGNVAFPLRSVDANARRRKVSELLHLVDATTLADRKPHQLSGGQQQRVAIARTLAANPSVLLLDEPFGALDAQARQELAESLSQWAQERNVPVLMVTHNLEEAFSGGEEILLMDGGRITAQGQPQEVLAGHRKRWLRALGVGIQPQ